MNCKNCGFEFQSPFCPNCGTKATEETTIAAEQLITEPVEQTEPNVTEKSVEPEQPAQQAEQIQSKPIEQYLKNTKDPNYGNPLPEETSGKLDFKTIYQKKWFWCCIGVLVLALIIVLIAVNSGNEEPLTTTSTTTARLTTTTIPTTTEFQYPEIPEEEITNVPYQRLFKNYSSYNGKYVRIVAKINSISSNNIKVEEAISGTLSCEILNADVVLKEFKPGDTVTIVGTVKATSSSEIRIVNCLVEPATEEHKNLIEAAEAKIIEQEKQAITDYKNNCKSVSYNQLARNPGDYKGDDVKFTGKVVQVMTSSYSSKVELRVNVTAEKYGSYTSYSDTVYVTLYWDSSSRILEDDIVTFYGKANGIKTYTSVLNASISIPWVEAEYLDIK